MYLAVADDAESRPSGWSQHAELSLTLVSQTDENCNYKRGPFSQSFDHFDEACKSGKGWGQGLTLVKFSAHPEHFLRSFVTETSQLIPQKTLKLS